ncbi:MAG: hypothetical protein OEU32_00965 [Acidimicrobiia bacterium]|nr:hypothetical protein [Acidimicrobiia bacterium]
MITVEVEAPVHELGDTVVATVAWDGLAKSPRGFTIELLAETVIDGTADVVARVAAPVDADTVSGDLEARIDLPLTGPISYEGGLFSVRWSVRVLADLALARDPDGSADLIVLPKGSAARWTVEAAPPSLP